MSGSGGVSRLNTIIGIYRDRVENDTEGPLFI